MMARRFVNRVLVGIVIVGAVMAPATLASGAPAPDSGLFGTWTNSSTSGLVKLVISSAGGVLKVDAFTTCSRPKPCELGKVSASVFAIPGMPNGRVFRTNQVSSTYNRIMVGRLISTAAGPRIAVDTFLTFKDGVKYNASGTRTFKRVGPATASSMTGTASSAYTSGRRPHAPDSFLGTWNNTNPATDFVVKYVITRAANGSLLVHEYGACSPTPCDNGTSNSISYAASTSSSTAYRFLAPSDYGFERELRVGSVSGGVLSVSAMVQYTDGSGRSNYWVAETFKH